MNKELLEGYKVKTHGHGNCMCFDCRTIAELELADAALAYVDVCPCDPDITKVQWEAWKKLCELRGRCEHNKGLTDYCQSCGRIHGG